MCGKWLKAELSAWCKVAQGNRIAFDALRAVRKKKQEGIYTGGKTRYK
jgi:hypothetical protein